MLGRWLEYSVHCSDILESLGFYRALGFTEVDTGDVWPHGYAVVSDGFLCIGLHARGFDSPALTFVQPELGHRARAMQKHGFEFSLMKLDADVFNDLPFNVTGGISVVMNEARSFTRPVEEASDSACGVFFELT